MRVEQRTPEIGVRIAVGATRGHLLALVLREATIMITIGAVAGIVMALVGGALIRNFLYDAKAAYVSVGVTTLITLLVTTLTASLLPAIRAAYLDPVQALRNE